ncbi:calmodulin-binding protein 60 B-like [Impatiens glandulifera]|uniref:calmodulin-binding protein 60 B-like n=1 Tax=Impatiens glandulifera TaxID=253017 RepID=UPI001FB0B4F8|nr:calmodulin-binding protein 60 B-like [Impatiens glandulifera]XP_047307956.1 calmodulin-binding protein 60 B-like [Impatiens glandulifera]
MESSNSMNKGKRRLEDDDQQSDRKRPALARVVVEALKVDSLQKLCSSLEPILRRVVSEEVERALAKLVPAALAGRSSPPKIEGLDGKKLQLQFRSRLSLPLFTGGKVEGEQGATVHVVLIDSNTGHVITSGPESSIKLDVVVLEGGFNDEDEEGWTQEKFESHVVKEREGKRPLLTGDLQLTLKEGVGTLGEIIFTDNSSWIRSRKFRLGLKVSSGFCDGIRILEAKTEAFTVKDHRGELYKKHYPPVLNDEIWRLEKIGKDGSFHKRLNSAGIFVVEDFLRLVVRDSQKLRNILGSGMSNKMWEALVEHAKTCVLSGKLYVYYQDDARNVGVAFNNIYELSGLIVGEEFHSADSLSETQKEYVDSLVKKAYEDWNQVVEYDGKSFLSFDQLNKSPHSTGTCSGSVDYPNRLENLHPTDGVDVSVIESSRAIEGFNRYPSQLLNTSDLIEFESDIFATQDQQIQNNNSSVNQSFVNNPFDDVCVQNQEKGVMDILSEEDIRLRSHEMLENEDMQHLLRLFSIGGDGQNSVNGFDDGFVFPSFMQSQEPDMGFKEVRPRPVRSVAGWLKIKAAMRWGFFIRKKAAERRAQIVELNDEEDE